LAPNSLADGMIAQISPEEYPDFFMRTG